LRVGTQPGTRLSSSDRVALIRKGNEFFNLKKYEAAKRVFITCRYSDGLIRLAQYHLGIQDPLEAFRLYWIAGDSRMISEMAERMAMVVRSWIKEGTTDAK